ncbi:hypothetical protein M422DRAFT_44405 [Sphaerobolus stellatus SS14]|nr:hypothetical protein M422DRAFT_44405 [Sphaerobolus stellatus SS14]
MWHSFALPLEKVFSFDVMERGKVICRCHSCRHRTFKHPGTNTVIQGVLITQRKFNEHQQRDVVHDFMESNSAEPAPTDLETIQEEERRLVSEAVLLANLQGNFANLALEDEATPYPTSFSDDKKYQENNQALVTLELKVAGLIAESITLRTALNDRPDISPIGTPISTGSSMISRLRDIHNTLMNIHGLYDTQQRRQAICKPILEELEQWAEYCNSWDINTASQAVRSDFPSDIPVYITDPHFNTPMEHADPILVLAVFCVVLVNIFGQVARRTANLILVFMQALVHTSFEKSYPNGDIPLYEQAVLNDFPNDPRSARHALKLEPKLIIFASCPDCHYCHPALPMGPREKEPIYPECCDRVPFPGMAPCGARLVELQSETEASSPKRILRPIRPFPFHDPKEFITSLVCRPGLEKVLDDYWKRFNQEGVSELKDLGDGSIIKGLLDIDMITRFAQVTSEVGHLVFALCVDWFNPYTLRIRWPSVTAGIISLACLNLPGDLRYLPENIFPLGVIPVPVIADYPATRKALGVKISARSDTNFCTFCDVPRTEISEWLDVHPSLYPRRTAQEHRQMAFEWRDAVSQTAQVNAFKKNGIRYIELLRLPYWDPTCFTVVDPMHNLFLGLIQTHFRGFLGIKAPTDKDILDPDELDEDIGEGLPTESQSSQPQRTRRRVPQVNIPQARRTLKYFETWEIDVWRKKMKALNRPTLDAICNMLNISIPSFHDRRTVKPDLVAVIEPEIQSNPKVYQLFVVQDDSESDELVLPDPTNEDNEPVLPDPLPSNTGANEDNEFPSLLEPQSSTVPQHKPHAHIGPQEILEIQRDLARIITPSWVTNLPANFGMAKAGSLSSDTWRAALKLYLPLTLIRIWGNLPATDRCKQVLNNTLVLVKALYYATLSTVMDETARQYTIAMKEYLKGLGELFPNKSLHPNHHMALHIEECLLQFGPVRGWWTFPFEQLIGALQHIRTSWKFGELERTMIGSYCVGANLRIVLSSGRFPSVLSKCKKAINNFFGRDTIGALNMESLHLDDPNTALDTFQINVAGDITANIDWSRNTRLPRDIYCTLLKDSPPE